MVLNRIKYPEIELSKGAKIGLAALLALGFYLLADFLIETKNKQSMKNLQSISDLARYERLLNLDDIVERSQEARLTIADFETGLFNEETDGLNLARFQTEVEKGLQPCEIERQTTRYDLQKPAEGNMLSQLQGQVSGNLQLSPLFDCFANLLERDKMFVLSDVRWAGNERFTFIIRGYAVSDVDGLNLTTP